MLENVLERKKCSLSVKITVKTLVSALIIALAVALPQLVHLAAGSEGRPIPRQRRAVRREMS